MATDVRRDLLRPLAIADTVLVDTVLADVLLGVISATVARTGRAVLDIVDVGGGTGVLAVPLASLGHSVTVLDPSPDALAAAQRRAAEVPVRLVTVQAEAASADSVTGAEAADLVICHNVLEYVDSPSEALGAIYRMLRPSGTVSLLASNMVATVLHRALAGRFAEARRLLADMGRPGGDEPRRFTLPELTALLAAAGLRAGETHGIRVFGGLVPGALIDADPGTAAALLELEQAAATSPPLRDIAAQLHLLGYR